jgi:hypothetical protein
MNAVTITITVVMVMVMLRALPALCIMWVMPVRTLPLI